MKPARLGCRCWSCDGSFNDIYHRIHRLMSVAEYAYATVAAQGQLDAATAQKDYAVEVARQPTTCDIPCPGEARCFGCPNRRVDSPFLERRDW